MSFVTTDEAKLHLRVVGSAEDTLIAVYIAAAELSAVSTIERKVYADGTALAAAIAAAPAVLAAALATYEAAVDAANLLTEPDLTCEALRVAEADYFKAKVTFRQTNDGIVVNDSIKSAVMLIIGSLYAQREDVVVGLSVTKLPNGAEWLLQPYRVYS